MVLSSSEVIEDQTNLLPRKKVILVITSLAITILISYIDQNSIAVILPSIGRDLNCVNTIQWAATSALIANTVFQVLFGRLSDIFGRNVVYFASIFLLALGDLLCALARTGPQFFAFRAIAGIGNGGINALAMIIVTDIVTLEERGKFQGIIGCCVGLGNVIGPFLAAGFLLSSWRHLFYIIFVLGVISGVLVFFTVPSVKLKGGKLQKLRSVDVLGTIFSSAAVILLLIPISDGGTRISWSSPMCISFLVLGSASAAMFLIVESKVSSVPMMPPSIFKTLAVDIAFVQNFLFGMAYYASLYYLPQYFENVRQWNTTFSAALLVPLVTGQSVTSVLSGYYISYRKRYSEVLWFGYTLWTLGAGLCVLFNKTLSPGLIVLILLIEGAGIGCTFQPTLIAAHAHSARMDRAIIVSIRNFIRLLGGSVGLASSAAIYSNLYQRSILRSSRNASDAIAIALASESHASVYALPANISSLPQAQRDALIDAGLHACRAVFVFWVPLVGLCLLTTVLIRDRGLVPRPASDDDVAIEEVEEEEHATVDEEKPGAARNYCRRQRTGRRIE